MVTVVTGPAYLGVNSETSPYSGFDHGSKAFETAQALSHGLMGLDRLWKVTSSFCRSISPLSAACHFRFMASAAGINKTAHPFSRAALEDLLNRRFFYAPAFEIYGGESGYFWIPSLRFLCVELAGVAGLYDYGPPGSSLHANILNEWRKHFIIEESMLEVDTTIMTPAPVFETSGHVARFADWMVKDTKTGDVLRADHLVEGVLEARLKGDKEARGENAAEVADVEKDKKKKKKVKSVAVKLEDAVVAEYEAVLAQVRKSFDYINQYRNHGLLNPD
jgi:glycyl-tRNA synthetase